jgi:hypothetical protein
MSPETIDLIKFAVNSLASGGLTAGVMKYRSRHSSQQSRAAAAMAAEALKTAADAARSVTEALRQGSEAGRSAMAAHKRLDDHERRITTLEVKTLGTERELPASISRIETLVRDSIKRVEDLVTGMASRIDHLADRG